MHVHVKFEFYSKNKDIERVHLKFCKLLLKVKSSTSNMAIYGELGRYPLYINRFVRIIKYWSKIHSSENLIVIKLYQSMLVDCNNGAINWASRVKSLLDMFGFSYVWHDPTSVDCLNFHNVFKRRAVEVFYQSWSNTISISPSLRLYCYYKKTIVYENYLDFVPKKYRISLSQLRLSSHALRIETGRYGNQRIDRHLRTCQLCNSTDIEDEYHCIIICPLYDSIRKKFIKSYYFVRPSVFKFTQLMQSGNKSEILNIAKFVFHAFSIRKQTIVLET